jgi:hypothetical protein
MHTFRPSRGRVLFEVFCALAIAASLAGGWLQTGAWALLPGAVIAALYSLVHAFNLAGSSPAGVPLSASDQQLKAVNSMESMELVEPEAPPVRKARKTKAPRKPRARIKATGNGKVTEPLPPQEEVARLVRSPEEGGGTLAECPEDVAHIPLAPLFEPEPFVRQQRAVFGRKAG